MLAPPEVLRAPEIPGVNPPRIDIRSQGVIPRQFKQKKKFCDTGTRDTGTPDGRTDVIVEIVM